MSNPEDCGSYIQCVHGYPVVQRCQEGLHWSISSGRCDWPYTAKCNVTEHSTTTSGPLSTIHSNSNGNWTNCIGVPSYIDVLLPNPKDCGSYIQCVHQKPVIRPCPSGLHWSVAANRCEWPNIAKCNTTLPTTTARPPTTTPTTNGNWSNCSGVPSDVEMLLPNPQDCGSYIQCVHQYPLVRNCTYGLHWNDELKACDRPENAGCQKNETTAAPSTTTEIPSSNETWSSCDGVPHYIDVLLPNPEDCGSYIQCVHQKPMVRPCPSGLHWSISTNRCDWPQIAKCNGTLLTTTPMPLTTTPSTNGNWTNCSSVPSNVDVLLQNPEDCGSYIQCVHQFPFVRNCTSGLHWNDKLKACDRPEDAGCQNNETTTASWSTTEIPSNSTITVPPTNQSWSSCDGVPHYIDVLLPNPEDCGSYIQCVHQKPMVRPCPSGLHWSISTNRCDWPQIAKCNGTLLTTTPMPLTTTPSPNGNWTNCSAVPSNVDVLLPNSEDCGSYIQCVNQFPLVRNCSYGLHWNDKLKACDRPEDAGCQKNETTAAPSPTTEIPSSNETWSSCDGVPHYIDVLLPNPEDCGSYIQCVHQKPMVRPCPAGLHWSVAANRCEWPNIAKCNITLPTSTATPATTLPPTNGNWTNCSGVPSDVDVLLSNPEDCGSYIQCVHQYPLVRNCTYGLHWNDELKVCDRPENAGCQKNQTTEIPHNSTTTTTDASTIQPWSSCDGVPHYIDVLLPNPDDCGSYIQCVHQKPVIRPCPGGLHWSVAANRCEWPDIAKCVLDIPA
ncbi:uncharacterized protein CBL_14554 [Carabus blaptoides fortunei]